MFRKIIVLLCLFLCACTGSGEDRFHPMSRLSLTETTKDITQLYLTDYSHLLLYDLSQVLEDRVLMSVESKKKWESIDYQGVSLNIQKWELSKDNHQIVTEYYSKRPIKLTNEFSVRLGTSYASPFQIVMTNTTINLHGTVFYTVELEDSVLFLNVVYQNLVLHVNDVIDELDIDGNLDFEVDFLMTLEPHTIETGKGTVYFSKSSIRFDNEERSFAFLDEGEDLLKSFIIQAED